MLTAVFRPEAVLTLFVRMRTKGIAKSLGKCMPIEELLHYYGNSLSPEWMAGSDFSPEAPKQPLAHMEVLLFWVNVHESKAIVFVDCEINKLGLRKLTIN